MVKNGVKADIPAKNVKKILITQPRPETDKSPYFELSRKYNIELEFHPFIRLEPIPAREFRKQKIEIQNYTGVIFTSRNAIDHFFRMCEEMKVNVSQDIAGLVQNLSERHRDEPQMRVQSIPRCR